MTLAVHTRGDGPDVVFLHGRGLSARIWQSLTDRLDSVRSHCVDLSGHGDSPGGHAGLNNWVDAVVEAVDAPAIYVGWSLGGLVALGAATRHPERVLGLGLIAALPRMVRETGWDWGLKPRAIQATREGLATDFTTTLSEFLMQQVLGEPGASRAIRSLRNDLIDHPPQAEALERGLDILFEADFRDVLGTIAQPSLHIAGARDRMADPACMAWAAERMPNADFWEVERAAHAPFISHEKRVADRLQAFVRARE